MLPYPVQVPLELVGVYVVPPIPVTVPRVGEAERIIPAGAVQTPDAVVQYWKVIVLIFVVEGVTNVKL